MAFDDFGLVSDAPNLNHVLKRSLEFSCVTVVKLFLTLFPSLDSWIVEGSSHFGPSESLFLFYPTNNNYLDLSDVRTVRSKMAVRTRISSLSSATGHNRLSAESMAGRWQSLRKIEYERRGGLAFGPRCNPGTPSLLGLPKWPPCPECCLAQHSNLALRPGPELRSPAPLRCGEGKGHPVQCGRRWLHAHENFIVISKTHNMRIRIKTLW